MNWLGIVMANWWAKGLDLRQHLEQAFSFHFQEHSGRGPWPDPSIIYFSPTFTTEYVSYKQPPSVNWPQSWDNVNFGFFANDRFYILSCELAPIVGEDRQSDRSDRLFHLKASGLRGKLRRAFDAELGQADNVELGTVAGENPLAFVQNLEQAFRSDGREDNGDDDTPEYDPQPEAPEMVGSPVGVLS